jgi:hypothetical protein
MSWQEQQLGEGPDFTGILDVADLDRDGDNDLAATTWFPGCFCWMENADGQGTAWEIHLLKQYSGYEDASWICCADIDGDGWEDVAGDSQLEDDIYWWGILPGASLSSSILYTGCDPDWGALLWSGQTPPGTAIGMQVRSSDDFSQMGAWSDTLWTPSSLQGILEDNTSYFQYRVVMTSETGDSTPVLTEVTVTWDPFGTGVGGAPESLELLPVSPNPCMGRPVLEFGLPAIAAVELAVYDVSGRVVERACLGEFGAGWHTVQLGDLSPGIYFVRITAGDLQAIQRFVVI